MIHLNFEQTLQLFYNKNKSRSIKNKLKKSTKSKWKCLKCLTPIYVTYKHYNVKNIVCNACRNSIINKPTIIQYHYMMALKSKQLKQIEDIFGVDMLFEKIK